MQVAPGRVAVNVCAWALLVRLWLDAAPAQRHALLACLLYATAGEVFGVIRLGRGLSYDPFNMIQCPFPLHGSTREQQR